MAKACAYFTSEREEPKEKGGRFALLFASETIEIAQ